MRLRNSRNCKQSAKLFSPYLTAADEGITGTSTKRREQFNRLMDDCRAGLIDRVLVKSASRFARNTADALSSVRELKSLGVTVAFEKEGFDTETSNGEMLLSIICAVAQEESLSISQNMKWGIHKRMRTGNYITNATPFGYTQINHQLVPEKNNAMIVNDIFKSYLSGMGINEFVEIRNQFRQKSKSFKGIVFFPITDCNAFVGGIFWVAVVPENFFSRRARCFRLIFHVFYLFSVSASAKDFLLKGK